MPNFVNPVGLNSTWFEKSQAGGTLMSATGQQFLNQAQYLLQWLWASGPTTSYPTNPVLGQLFYDTTLNAQVECTNVGSPTTGTAATWGPVSSSSASTTISINTQTASYVLALTDAGICVEMNVATANNLTIPANATVAFPVDTIVMLRQQGAGVTTIVAAAGVTIRSPRTLVFAQQYGTASLHKRGTNEWCVDGDLT